MPLKKEIAIATVDVNLVRIVTAAEAVLRVAYLMCSDMSPDRKMTQRQANILNEFYVRESGTPDGFRYFKNASTLVILPFDILQRRTPCITY